MPWLIRWSYPLLKGGLLLGSLGLLLAAGPSCPGLPVRWQLQHRSTSHGCLDTTIVRTWRRGEQDIRSGNLNYGKKAGLLEENGLLFWLYDVLLNNQKVLTQTAHRTKQHLTVHGVRAPVQAVGFVLGRTPRLLVISWLPGSIDVYQIPPWPRTP